MKLNQLLCLIDLSAARDHTVALSPHEIKFSSGLGKKVTELRSLIFNHTKLNFWQSILEATTKVTSPPMDEYEKPDDIPEFAVNRIIPGKMKENVTYAASILGQLTELIENRNSSQLRRAFVDVQDAGQERAFYVDFIGEGVSDHGGPYRAVFEAACCVEPRLLGLAVPVHVEHGQEFEFPAAAPKEEQEMKKRYNGLGKIVGLAVRHKICVDLAISDQLWRTLAGLHMRPRDLERVDTTLWQAIRNTAITGGERELLDSLIGIAAGDVESLTQQGIEKLSAIELADQSKIAGELLAIRFRRNEIYIDAFCKGLGTAIPIELLPLFTPSEIYLLVCGRNNGVIETLKAMTEYDVGISESDNHIQHFWEALEQLDPHEEIPKFIRFVSGSSRLPASTGRSIMPFKILRPEAKTEQMPEIWLPTAQTCFFSMHLPRYADVRTCLEKLRYAFSECTTMDADFHERNHLNHFDEGDRAETKT